MLPIYSMEHGQMPSGKPVKANSVLSHQKSSTMKNSVQGPLPQYLGFSSMASCQDSSFLWGQLEEGKEIVRETFCLLFSTVSLQLSMLLQKKLPCPFQSAAVWIKDFQMASGDSVDHRHPHSLRNQQDHRPPHRLRRQHRTSNTDISMTFGGSIYNGHQHDLLHRPVASTWPPAAGWPWTSTGPRAGAQAPNTIISFILKSPCGLIRVNYFIS